MKVLTPRVVAAALVASLIASPVILDACMFTCHGSTATDEDRSEPSCHHGEDDADLRLEAPPAPCGHDHSPSPSTVTAKPTGVDPHGDALFMIASSASPHDVASPAPVVTNAVGPPFDVRSRASSPLRI